MAADGTTIMLAALASVLVLYVVQQERKSGPGTLGSKNKPRASLGTAAGKVLDCSAVSIDSPDFARCSTTLGAGRTVVRGKPRADAVNRGFLKDEFNLGNPFAVKIDDKFVKDTNNKLGKSAGGGEAFPFSKTGSDGNGTDFSTGSLGKGRFGPGPPVREGRGQSFKNAFRNSPPTEPRKIVEAPSRGSARSSVTLGSSEFRGGASLGAAVSPSSLGASPEDISRATNKLDEIDNITSNTGGNLNLLHPL